MKKIQPYLLGALAVIVFLIMMFLLYQGTQRNDARSEGEPSSTVSLTSAPVAESPTSSAGSSESSSRETKPTPSSSASSSGSAEPTPSASSSSPAANSASPEASASATNQAQQAPAACPGDVSYPQVASGQVNCTFDYSQARLQSTQDVEQYARTWIYTESGTYMQVLDHRENKIPVEGFDEPQSVFVVRAAERSPGDEGGSGNVGWTIIWPNGYYITSN